MKLFNKEELIEEIRKIFEAGWMRSVKRTVDRRNDGAVGNTLESLLGIMENNLPLPNAREWELKGQRKHTTSLVTLKHIEPSPTGAKIVSSILLPLYGWKHKEAGKKYPDTEKSFRSTTSAVAHTNRGFRVMVDRDKKKVIFAFDASKADTSNSEIAAWLRTVQQRVGLGSINPEPYWAFDDLKYAIGSKIKNCFYVIADTKTDNKHEHFKYEKLLVLSGFSFDKFLDCVEKGYVYVDFDARTGHNHGTKFRVKQNSWPELYSDIKFIEQ
ncbi:MAG: MvaI/BcnI restriction endonuclease family protein [Nitrospirae bacterium]|nr:MvaI/BcnI restriction endonuclease family protein [Nitrospirota bacterium]